jgi:hypothetical protein
MASQQAEANRQFEIKKHDDEMAVRREEIAAKLELGQLKEIASDIRHNRDTNSRIDSDNNGIDDYLDIRRTEVDEQFKQEQIRIADEKLEETKRANKAKEEIQKKAAANKPSASK